MLLTTPHTCSYWIVVHCYAIVHFESIFQQCDIFLVIVIRISDDDLMGANSESNQVIKQEPAGETESTDDVLSTNTASLCRQTDKPSDTQNIMFECTICNDKFAKLRYLNQHYKRHSDARPFECPTCQKTFKTSQDLHQHQSFHVGIKRFVCQFCEKGFVHNGGLMRHVRTHTGVQPFPCSLCSKTFDRVSSRDNHMTSVHGKSVIFYSFYEASQNAQPTSFLLCYFFL